MSALDRTIEIDEFVPRSEIDDLYLARPYYLCPTERWL
jgi:DNA end-binding protein Ku